MSHETTMRHQWLLNIVTGEAILSVILNTFCSYIIWRHSSKVLGYYKWVLFAVSFHEAVYTFTVLIVRPVHFITDNRWFGFATGFYPRGMDIDIALLGIYCSLYALGIGLHAFHFLYRYIVFCKPNISAIIKDQRRPKVIITLVILVFSVYCCVCGIIFCTRNRPNEAMKSKIREEFSITHPEDMGFILFGIKVDEHGNFSLSATAALFNHIIVISLALLIVAYCGIAIYHRLRVMRKESQGLKRSGEYTINKQIFAVLLIQTVIPLFTLLIPILASFSFPLWPADVTFGIHVPLPGLKLISGILNPIATLVCIRDFRRGIIAEVSKISGVRISIHFSTPNQSRYARKTESSIANSRNSIAISTKTTSTSPN